jgi:hypothetical protein
MIYTLIFHNSPIKQADVAGNILLFFKKKQKTKQKKQKYYKSHQLVVGLL